MNVTVIGGGGAFDDNNSSFLIEISEAKILFDCNFQTFLYYKHNLKDIDYVFISHTHFDHIGGLEQLIFYRYYVQGKKTKIVTGKDVKDELEKILESCNTSYVNGEVCKIKTFEILTDLDIPEHNVDLIKGDHIVKPNYGLLIKDDKEKKALFISGDTKASINIKTRLKNLSEDEYTLTVFHDLSFWDDEDNNIHCCPTELKRVYGELIDNPNVRWINYHNAEFDSLYKDRVINI